MAVYYKGNKINEIDYVVVEQGDTINNQVKVIDIEDNGTQTITYDEGFTGLESITINTNIPEKEITLQALTVNIEDNGTQTITYDEAYDGIGSVTINTNVKCQGGGKFLCPECISFSGSSNTTEIDLTNFDTSNVTSMRFMFSNCSKLQSLDVSNFDTSNVTKMDNMFQNCSGLTELDVSNFDTSNVNTMSYMFSNCKKLQSLDVSNFDTSNVTSMTRIFESCKVETLDLSTWDTSKVKIDSNAYSRPFYDFEGKYLILGDKCKFENVNYFSNMFRDCRNLISLDLSNWNIPNATTMDSMFRYCTSLTSLDVSNFNTSNVTGMSYMFSDCYSLTSIDLSSFDTSNVTKMDNMFYNCHILQRIDGFIDWTKISSYPSNFIYTTSSYGNPLRYMVIKNIGKTGTTFNFNNTSLQNWGDESDTATYPLSVGARQSLVDSLLTYSYDRASNGLSTCTIQLHPNVKARLTEDEITAIQNKGYTIS